MLASVQAPPASASDRRVSAPEHITKLRAEGQQQHQEMEKLKSQLQRWEEFFFSSKISFGFTGTAARDSASVFFRDSTRSPMDLGDTV
jgi:hypothetical protein